MREQVVLAARLRMSDPAPNPIRDALDHPQNAPQLVAPGSATSKRAAERPPFPPGCPIVPLGMSSDIGGSQACYYLDFNKQLVGLEAGNRHGKNSLIALFGPASDWLEESFPQWSKPVFEGRGANRVCVKESEIIGFDQAEASRALIEECVRRGIFTAANKMRGNGAHRHENNGLVLHCGDKLLTSVHNLDGTIRGWTWIDCGLHGVHVYPGGEKLPRPQPDRAGPEAAQQLVRLLSTWNWKRKTLDVRLLLGAICAGMVGGALKWRPNIWITGGRGTGKSTLNGEEGVVHQLYGEGLFRTGNASAAAIRQTLRNSTVPVLFDEIEASADNRRVQDVIELARVASSGEKAHRGSADGTAQEFTLRSCFWFSSINIPPLQAQDRSRLGILELQPFEDGAPPPVLADWHLAELGRKLQRRMVDGWARLEATKARYHQALADVGHEPRACDQFGTLLACADLALFDWEEMDDGLPDDEEVAHWADMCRPEKMAEISEATADHVACIDHLLTAQVQARGGDERESLGSWIGKAIAYECAPLLQNGDREGDSRAAARLQQLGLKLVKARWYPEERDRAGKVVKAARWGTEAFDKDDPIWLAVAGKHQALAKIYEGQTWQDGVWRQSLARTTFKGDGWQLSAIDGPKVKFGHQSQRAVLVPLAAVVDESELPDASRPEEAAAWVLAQKKGGAE